MTGLAGCGPLVDSIDEVGIVASALSFTPDPLSGDKEKSEIFLLITPRVVEKEFNVGLPPDADAKLHAAVDACTPEVRPEPIGNMFDLGTGRIASTSYLAFNLPEAAIALGQIVVNQVYAELQGRVSAIKQRNKAAHVIRRAWSPATDIDWVNVNCLIVARIVSSDQGAFGLHQQIDPSRIRTLVILQRIGLGSGAARGTIWAPIYARVDRSVAETGIGSAENKAAVRLNINLALTTISSSAKGGAGQVNEVLNASFQPIRAAFGEPAQVCDPWPKKKTSKLSSHPICPQATTLSLDPHPGAPIYLTLVVSESGSALSDAEAAEKALKDIQNAAKPTVDGAISKLAAKLSE